VNLNYLGRGWDYCRIWA